MKNTLIFVLVVVSSFLTSNAIAGHNNWKLKLDNSVNNILADTIRILWYCDGNRKDKDTVAYLKKKTRELSYSKCKNGDELTVKFKIGSKLYLPISVDSSFTNGFFGQSEFKFYQQKHCFNVSNNLISGQPAIKVINC
jgi:hypothetical protein